MKIKKILVSQPQPLNDNSPYFSLQEKYHLKIDFRPFIQVEGLHSREVRKQKIDFSNFNAVIFTSRNAIDHYFRLAEDMRYEIKNGTKYFCQSVAVASYLQKYVVYRKRKIYTGKVSLMDLKEDFGQHKNLSFLLPTSDVLKPNIPSLLNDLKINWERVELFKTVSSDLSDLENIFYDLLVFFSPSGISSLLENFPNFKQNNTRIAVFGNTTLAAAEQAGLVANIKAPTKKFPSMTMAISSYIEEIKTKEKLTKA